MKQITLSRRGHTMLELLLVGGLAAFMVAAMVAFFARGNPFSRQSKVRQDLLQEARTCIDHITQMVGYGRVGTLNVSTHDDGTGAPPPRSKISFVFHTPLANGATAYKIYLEKNIVYAQEFNPAGLKLRKTLANNVTGLSFTGDSIDPAIVTVGMQMENFTGKQGDKGQLVSVMLPNTVVRMAE